VLIADIVKGTVNPNREVILPGKVFSGKKVGVKQKGEVIERHSLSVNLVSDDVCAGMLPPERDQNKGNGMT
jgi:hypothetical protein